MAWLLTTQAAAHAAEKATMQLHYDADVLYCTVHLPAQRHALEVAMQDGIPVTTTWHIRIHQRRDYWLDQEIAELTLTRRVEPDLLAKSWHLVDEATGIDRYVMTVGEALHFLTALERVPVLDRALLAAGQPYRITIGLEQHVGKVNPAWWARLWGGEQQRVEQQFTLP